MTRFVVYNRRGGYVLTTTVQAYAEAWRAATGGWIVPIVRQPTIAELHRDERVAA